MSNFRKLRYAVPVAVALALALSFGGYTFSQQAGQPEPGVEGGGIVQPQLEQAQVRLQEVYEQLMAIEQDTMANRPDLQQEQQELERLAIATMEEMGHNPKQNVERLEEIRDELQEGPADTEQLQTLLQDFEEQRMQLAAAQQEALQNQELREAHIEFQGKVLEAQRERHPQTDALIEELLQLQQQLQGGSPHAPVAPQ
jgi:DNA repair exonuclease SbcCD ATPase subunit